MGVVLHEVGRLGGTAYWGSLEAAANPAAASWALWTAGLWRGVTQSNGRQPRAADAAMADAARRVLPLGPPDHTAHSGCGAVDGSPGELGGGKRIAQAAL